MSCSPRPTVLDAILTATVLGFLAGVIPGPYTTIVASTAVERGFARAWPLAFVPLVTDVPAMLATVFLLRRLDPGVLTVVGVAGGVVVAGIGVRFLRSSGRRAGRPSGGEAGKAGTFWATVWAGLLSPAPWIFWLVAASPLLLRAWSRSPAQGIVFALTLFTLLVGSATGVAWVASHGAGRLDGSWRRRIVRALGAGLMLAGGVLVWQSFAGNFQAMVQRQEELRERLD